MVFEDLELEDYGNRPPQIKVEVWGRSGDMEPLIRGVNVIPGSTESGYDPEQVDVVTYTGSRAIKSRAPMNCTRDTAKTDWSQSMDLMDAAMPNCDTVSLVVAWFGDDLRAGQCRIMPRVEFMQRDTLPRWWAGGLTYYSDWYGEWWSVTDPRAEEVSRTPDGGPAYGSSPSDASIIRAIQDLKARGKRVVLYPFVMMDIQAVQALPDPSGAGVQPDYPWRGRLQPMAGEDVAAEVSAFVDGAWGFRNFVTHLADLASQAGGVDAFLIGSEMRGMSMAHAGGGSFPFVDALKSIAADVRGILPSAQISYAADWSEYHSFREGGDVFFHLDPLWSDPNIDFVGIDNYLPLSDWRDGPDHLDRDDEAGITSPYVLDYLKANIEGGEYWDWYYASDADREAQARTPIFDGAHGEDWIFRQKAIRDWHGQPHYDRPAGLRDSHADIGGTPTTWGAIGGTVSASAVPAYGSFGTPADIASAGSYTDRARLHSPNSLDNTGGKRWRARVWFAQGTSAEARLLAATGGPPPNVRYDFASGAVTPAENGHTIHAATVSEVSPGVFLMDLDITLTAEDETPQFDFGAFSSAAGEYVTALGAEVFEAGVSTTGWVPGSKPVWFTELGCPAVDKGANQPNVFAARYSSESALPWFSQGFRDDFMQRQFLRASFEWWAENGGDVLDVADVQVWAWDARPFPEFPQKSSLWSDGPDWRLGHWLNGRAGAAPAGEAIRRRAVERYGIDPEQVDIARAYGQADGYAAPGLLGFREYVQPLELAHGLQSHEEGGRLVFASRGAMPTVAALDPEGMAPKTGDSPFTVTRSALEDVAAGVVLTFRDGADDYAQAATRAVIGRGPEEGEAATDLPLVLDHDSSTAAASRLVRAARDGRETVTFRVPRSATHIRPGVVVPVLIDGEPRLFAVQSVADGLDRSVEAQSFAAGAWAPSGGGIPSGRSGGTVLATGVLLLMMDLPTLPGVTAEDWDGFAATFGLPWPGAVVASRSADAAGGFLDPVAFAAPATMGETLAELPPDIPGAWRPGPLDIAIYSGELVPRDPLDVLAGRNMLAVRHPDGWEIVRFTGAELLPSGAGHYRLTGLLRGDRGTEGIPAAAPLAATAPVVLLDAAVQPLGLELADVGRALYWRFGPGAADVTTHATKPHAFTGAGLRPFAPAHLEASPAGADLALSWMRRSRVKVDTLGDALADPPLGETAERYRVEIGPAGAPVRTWDVTAPAAVYTAAQMASDGIAAPYRVAVAQISETYGPGTWAEITVEA
ncbi:glycoside hydrolase TIM-barrel-like domain-containing protein [Poseidonocella sp. HB161398]|uniref:baseplate megatron protein TIM-barrel domain-containing protein n=1 Tax=Poseidonocella sp. HB161398 TaxID=2320855 RepID=UPI001107FC9F|nr:glycoside hydrolase TIM-barrel-like domain-containing protein [Poseidonocella sp. HB161398]